MRDERFCRGCVGGLASVVMIYFGEASCDDCLDQLMGICTVVDSLKSKGVSGLAGYR